MKSRSDQARHILLLARSICAGFLALCMLASAQAFQPLVTDDTGTQEEDANQIELTGTPSRAEGTMARGWRNCENENQPSLAYNSFYLASLSSGKVSNVQGAGWSSCELSLILTQAMAWAATQAKWLPHRANDLYSYAINNEQTWQFSLPPVWDIDKFWTLTADFWIAPRTRACGTAWETRFSELGEIYSPNKDIDLAIDLIRENIPDSGVVTNIATAGVT